MQHAGSLLPNQGSNLCPLQWKCRLLTTGLPGKSRHLILSYGFILSDEITHLILHVVLFSLRPVSSGFHPRQTGAHILSHLGGTCVFLAFRSLGCSVTSAL